MNKARETVMTAMRSDGHVEFSKKCRPVDLLPDIRHVVDTDEDKTVRIFLQLLQTIRPEPRPIRVIFTSVKGTCVDEVRIVTSDPFFVTVLKLHPVPGIHRGRNLQWKHTEVDSCEMLLSLVQSSGCPENIRQVIRGDLERILSNTELAASITNSRFLEDGKAFIDMCLRSSDNKPRLIRLIY